jgi:hypothetical protein
MLSLSVGGGAAQLGAYAYAYVFVVFVLALATSFVLQPFVVLFPRLDEIARRAYVGFAFAATTVIALVPALATTLVAGFAPHSRLFGGFPPLLMVTACVYGGLNIFVHLARRCCYLHGAPRLALLISGTQLTTLILALSGCWATGRLTASNIFCSLAGSSVTSLLIGARLIASWLQAPSPVACAAHARSHFTLSKWILPTVPLALGASHLYYLLAVDHLPPESIGTAKGVEFLALPFEQILVGLSLMFVPQLSAVQRQSDSTRNWSWAVTSTRKLLIAAGLYVVLVLPLLPLLAAPLRLTTLPLGTLAAAFFAIPLARTIAWAPNVLATSTLRPDTLFWAYGAGTLFTLTIGQVLMSSLGTVGIPVGLALSALTVAAVLWIAAWVRHRRQFTPRPVDSER